MRWRRHGQAALAARVAMTAVVLGALPAPLVTGKAGAAGGQELAVGQVVTLDQPGVSLRAPADGRLAGYAFSGGVSGVAFTSHAGVGAQAVVAGAGTTLVVVSAGFAPEVDAPHKTEAPDDSPAAALVSGGQQASLPLAASQAGWQGTWAIAVADGAPADLAVSEAGFTQTLDLRTGRRLAPDPAVLYRSATPDVVTTPNVTTNLTAMTTVGGAAGSVPFTLGVTGAELTFFTPDATSAPLAADQAYLVVDTSSPAADDSAGNQVDVDATLPASALSLQLGDAASVHPVSGGGSTQSGTLFADTYTFVVPADLTDATLAVTPGSGVTGTVFDPSTYGNDPVTLAFAGSADLSLRFPPPDGPPRRSGTGGAGPTAQGGASAAGAVAAGAASFLVLAIVIAAVVVVRRRRWLPARPVTRSQRALLAATAGELLRSGQGGWGPPAALPPAPAMLTAGSHPTPPPGPWAEDPAATATAPSGQAAGGPALVIRIFGRLDVEGLTGTVRRRALTRLVVCLAVEDREVTVEELRDLIATDPDQPPSVATIHSLASKLRAHLPAGLLPPIGPGQVGYRLAGIAEGTVEVDWQLFSSLAHRATAAPDDAERLELTCRALRLVTGPPLDHGTWDGITRAVRAMETAVETTATDAARLALTGRDPRTAEWAVARGLTALPGSVACWELRLIAAAGGSGYGLERAWADCMQALGADAEMLRATYERLRTGSF